MDATTTSDKSMTEHPLTWEPSADDIDRYRHHGDVVLRDAFDPAPLTGEVNAAFAAGFAGPESMNVSVDADIAFRYLPMMSERTPISIGLLLHFAGVADVSSMGATATNPWRQS